MHSLLVYQGLAYAETGTRKEIRPLIDYAINGVEPDVTFYLQISVEESLKRKRSEGSDRIESRSKEYKRGIIKGYDTLAIKNNRIVTIDGSQDVDTVAEKVKGCVDELYGWR